MVSSSIGDMIVTDKKNVHITEQDIKNNNMLNNMISTIRQFSSTLFGESPDGSRNYKDTFGYLSELSYADNHGMYKRGGIANAVVSKVAKACWRDTPIVKNGEVETIEDIIEDLKEVGLFKALEKADILNRIGKYSIMFVGVQDGDDFSNPIGVGGNIEDLYFNVYSEDGVQVLQWDTDPSSPRYGLPLIYQLQVTNLTSSSGMQSGIAAIKVHYSRVVHLAEGALENPVEGSSALEPVWNALIDKDKIRGSASESYYRNSRQKFGLMAGKDASFPKDQTSKDALQSEVEKFSNNFQDFMRLKNMDVKVFQPSIGSPRDAYDICVEEISGTTGIPVRILTGKGGGQTVGNEDKASWNALVLDRQQTVCTDWFLQSLRILESASVIGSLPEKLSIEWPQHSALTEKEKTEVNDIKATTIQKISSARSTPGGQDIDLKSTLVELDLENIELDDSPLPMDEL